MQLQKILYRVCFKKHRINAFLSKISEIMNGSIGLFLIRLTDWTKEKRLKLIKTSFRDLNQSMLMATKLEKGCRKMKKVKILLLTLSSWKNSIKIMKRLSLILEEVASIQATLRLILISTKTILKFLVIRILPCWRQPKDHKCQDNSKRWLLRVLTLFKCT